MAANPRLRQEEPSLEAAVLTRDAISFELLLRRQVGFYQQYGKRALDLVLGSVLLLLTLPVVLALCLLVLLTSGRPVFYLATRLGKNGKEFRMVKLRTMVRDADRQIEQWQTCNPGLASEYEQNFKLRNDPRITPFGRLLRRTSLDELPQLWNVIRGEMSLVGPRPYYLHELNSRPEAYKYICSVRPGLTGPWQIGGRNAIHPEERIRMDCDYITRLGAASDFSCLAGTAIALLRADGV